MGYSNRVINIHSVGNHVEICTNGNPEVDSFARQQLKNLAREYATEKTEVIAY